MLKGTYREKDLRELYRVDNKYWKTGDVDILSARTELAERIHKKRYDSICAIVSLATRENIPIKSVVEILEIYGLKMEPEGGGWNNGRNQIKAVSV